MTAPTTPPSKEPAVPASNEPADALGQPPDQPSGSDTPAAPVEAPYRRPLNLLAYPYFSQQERDRRWTLTRAAMAARDLDCLVIPNNTGHSTHLQADARYLTHVGGGGDADVAAVFPLEGEPAAVVTNRDRWVQTQPWCHDLREAKRSYGAGVLDKLRELPIPPQRIGIVGLTDAVEAPEGTAGHGFLSLLMRELPNAQWLDFTAEMEAIRIVKSAEEIAFLEHSTRIVDAAYEAAVAATRPGVTDHFVWGTLVESLCTLGSELPVTQRWIGGHRPKTMVPHATLRAVEDGWLFRSEVEAAWGGYRARGAQPFACGKPDRAYADLGSFLADVWNETLAHLRPGMSVGEVIEALAQSVARQAPRSGSAKGATASLGLQGCGLGADAPFVTRTDRRPRDLVRSIAEGWCFFFKVSATSGEYRLNWGDTIVVTDRGLRRLGSAPPGIVVASW